MAAELPQGMPKTKAQKQQIVENLAEKLAKAKSVVLAGFTKLTVKDNEVLRRLLQPERAEYYVTKKTLLQRALQQSDLTGVASRQLPGQLALVFGYGDEVAPAKVLQNFVKTHPETIEFLGGILERRFVEASLIKQLAALPGKQELYAQLVGSINAPNFGLVSVLQGNIRKLVYAFNAMANK